MQDDEIVLTDSLSYQGDKRIALDDEDVKLHVNGAVVTIHVEAER